MDIQIIRSRRRRKTVSARVVDGRLVVRAPHALPEAELRRLAERLRERILRRRRRHELARREDLGCVFDRLNRAYFDGRLAVASIGYSMTQKRRYGSCNPAARTIRISHRLAALPPWVRDYVVVHEMAHLLEPGHGPAFRALVDRFPLAERARGFLLAKEFDEEADQPGPVPGEPVAAPEGAS